MQRGDSDELAYQLEAVRASAQQHGPFHRLTLRRRCLAAMAFRNSGDLERALYEQRATVGDFERELGADHADAARARQILLALLLEARRFDEAEPIQRRILDAGIQRFGPSHSRTMAARYGLGNTLLLLGRYSESEGELRVVADAAPRLLGPDHLLTVASTTRLEQARRLAQ